MSEEAPCNKMQELLVDKFQKADIVLINLNILCPDPLEKETKVLGKSFERFFKYVFNKGNVISWTEVNQESSEKNLKLPEIFSEFKSKNIVFFLYTIDPYTLQSLDEIKTGHIHNHHKDTQRRGLVSILEHLWRFYDEVYFWDSNVSGKEEEKGYHYRLVERMPLFLIFSLVKKDTLIEEYHIYSVSSPFIQVIEHCNEPISSFLLRFLNKRGEK